MEQASKRIPFSRLTTIEIMLAILFFVVPFYYHIHLGGTGLRLPNNISIWFTGSLIITLSLYAIAKTGRIIIPRYHRYFLAFPLLITIVSVVNGVKYPLDWVFRLLAIWGGYLFFIAVIQAKIKRARIDNLLLLIVISALLQSLIGIAQVHVPLLIPTEWIPRSNSLQPFGMFQQINNQGTFLVTALLIAFYLISRPVLIRGRNIYNILLLLFFATSCYVIALSGSRIAILSILISLPVLFYARKKIFLAYKQRLFYALIFVFIGVFLGASGLNKVFDKTNNIAQGYGANARLEIYKISTDLIRNEPIFGYGIGSFIPEYHQQKLMFNEQHASPKELFNEFLTHPHNEILLWMIETGVIGLIGILLLSIGIIMTLKESHYRLTFFAFMIPILLHTQVELPLYTSSLHWFLLLFLLSIFVNTGRNPDVILSLSTSMQGFMRFIVVPVIWLIVCIFFIHTLLSNYELGKQNDVWKFDYAHENPYFTKLVESMQYKMLFLEANKRRSKNGVRKFVHWGEDYIKQEPSEQMYLFMSLGYANLSDSINMCRIAKEGALLYPESENLESAYAKCKTDKIRH